MQRLREIDILRGFAIFIMVIANYSPYFIDNLPVFLRLVYTFAAPLFISITGFIMIKNKIEKNYNYSYFLSRGISIITIGCLIDLLIYKTYPFFSFDVLYLIGACTLIFPILFHFWNKLKLWSIIIIFLLTIIIQLKFSYDPNFIEYSLFTNQEINFLLIFNKAFLDGFFPIFPWSGIFMIGFALYEEKYKTMITKNINFLTILFLIFSFLLVNSPKYIREGYAELFYPPDYLFILWAIAFIFLSFSLIHKINNFLFLDPFFKYLELIGKSSLFFYIFHLAAAEYIFSKMIETKILEKNFIGLLISYISTLIVMFVIGLIFEKLKKDRLPKIVKFFIGS